MGKTESMSLSITLFYSIDIVLLLSYSSYLHNIYWLYNNNYNTISSTMIGCGCGFHTILLLYLHWCGAVVVYLLHPGVTVECTEKLQYGLLISSSCTERTCF